MRLIRLACALCIGALCAGLMTGCGSEAPSSKSAKAAEVVDAQMDELFIIEDMRDEFSHGEKGARFQKYIVLHDTESQADASTIVEYWDQANKGVAAHFIVNRDGSIIQCVPLDKIAHHAGFGNTGNNARYDVTDESRDDKVGSTPIGGGMDDYGMNSYSIGIEMAHAAGQDYPEAQLLAVDALIAYINDYYGFESRIIDHKDWRTGNSDTSKEFTEFLMRYKLNGTHG